MRNSFVVGYEVEKMRKTSARPHLPFYSRCHFEQQGELAELFIGQVGLL